MAANPRDRSGTIITGGVAQELAPVNNDRRGWSLQNNSTSDLWFLDTDSTATAPGPGWNRVPPGALYESVEEWASGFAVQIYGAVTGQAFTAKFW